MKPVRNKIKRAVKIFLFILITLVITVGSLEYFSHYEVTKNIHSEAPVITRKSIVINAPAEKVWAIFKNVDKWDQWQKEITSPVLHGQFEAGSSFNWKSNGLTIKSTLTSVEPGKSVSWSGPAFGAFAIHNWSFSESNGKTTVRVEESMEGWLVSLLKGKFQSTLNTSIENWLNYLKTEAEREQKQVKN